MSSLGTPNAVAIACFFVFIAITLGITYWAARRTRTTAEFYAAGHSITGFQNGLALAGDYMRPVVLFLIAEPLRNLGKYTFADVVAYRLSQVPIRICAAIGTLAVVVFYLIAQMVGAGNLIKLMFGLSYETAIVVVGLVMIAYVLFGGMIATTWVQIVKAVMLLSGALMLTALVLARFGWNPITLFSAAAAKYGDGVLAPGKLVTNPWDAISLGLALMFGTAGLPHILMRFYTVRDAKAARTSVFYATAFIGFFYLLTFVLGFGAMVLVGQDAIRSIDKGGNMAAPLLAEVVGGSGFLGFIAAVAFATILAVVAGLTLSGAAALSHDLWVNVFRGGHADDREQLRVARLATLVLGAMAIALGITFKGQNVAFMVGLAFAIAASANFPALFLSMFWRGFSTAGAVASMTTGTATALLLIYLSPTIQIDVLAHGAAWFPLKNPGLVTVPLSFAVGIGVSLLRPDREAKARFAEVERRALLGVTTEG
jgi:cation/acetate symporter